MAEKKTELLTAGALAKALKAPDARVKKAIKELGIQPAARRGVCNLYAPDAVAKLKAAISK
jgi:hypothetical protein